MKEILGRIGVYIFTIVLITIGVFLFIDSIPAIVQIVEFCCGICIVAMGVYFFIKFTKIFIQNDRDVQFYVSKDMAMELKHKFIFKAKRITPNTIIKWAKKEEFQKWHKLFLKSKTWRERRYLKRESLEDNFYFEFINYLSSAWYLPKSLYKVSKCNS